MSERPVDAAAIEAEVDQVRSLGIDALRKRWRMMFGATPPQGLTKDIIARMIAYRIQEEAFGGLDRETVKLLDRLARGEKPSELNRRLKPGTVLVREYKGERHTVTVVPDGFVWQDAPTRAFRPSPGPLPAPPGMARAFSACAFPVPEARAATSLDAVAAARRRNRQSATAPRCWPSGTAGTSRFRPWISRARSFFRCAIYTRKSTEHNLDLEFNSLDAQREACEAYIKSQAHEGWRLISGPL